MPIGQAKRTLGTAALTAGFAVALAPPAPAVTAPARYTALGDSYTSGPLIFPLKTNPLTCFRSDANYPSLVTRALGTATLRDVSCAGARTEHMAVSQQSGQPPQLSALSAGDELVTVGIGFNDASLGRVVAGCPLAGVLVVAMSCRDRYVVDGHDVIHADIRDTAPKLARMLDDIHARAPRARVLVVGYPQMVPSDARACPPVVPLSASDNRYFDGLLVALNDELKTAARAHDAEYVDVYTRSIGHDMCTAPGTRWWEGVIPAAIALPLHPNALGARAQADAVLRTLATPRPAPVLSDLLATHHAIRRGRKARFSYRLNRAAPVTFVLARRARGRRAGDRCAPLRASNRGKPRCMRWTGALRTVAHNGEIGANTIALSARHMSRPSLYRLLATAATGDAVSAPVSVVFRVTSARKR